jgi:hypothetical protein
MDAGAVQKHSQAQKNLPGRWQASKKQRKTKKKQKNRYC